MNNIPDIVMLRRLARLYGIQTSYYDVNRQRKYAGAETLLGILKAMGAEINDMRDIPDIFREKRQYMSYKLTEPVTVIWDNNIPVIGIQLPSGMGNKIITGHLTMETGEQRTWKWEGDKLPVSRFSEIEGRQYVTKYITLPENLSYGYHHFALDVPGGSSEVLLIAAPGKAYRFSEDPASRIWGVFLPLYSLHTRQSWGAGDYLDLKSFMNWIAECGGGLAATLPLLAAFLDRPFDYSPYAPVSRLMWNEFYINIDGIPELQKCPSAQTILSSSSLQRERAKLQSLPVVDYMRQMSLKRRILEELCRYCFTEASDRLESLNRFAESNPPVEEYARFRAVRERVQEPWQLWPESLREGSIKEGDYDEEVRRYYLYSQWLANQQIENLSMKEGGNGPGLYLDFPLGVHHEGFDVWRERGIFTAGVSGGAPPDTVFTMGQDWGFPPMHPEELRQQGYSYYINCIRHHLRHAGMLRIDHVMGLHRLFWIPKGMEASKGAYVRYRPEEFYAILALESRRNRAVIVGEDMGTVPSYVRKSMNRHGLNRMYVAQYELLSEPNKIPKTVPVHSVAGLDTHDMPLFASFWQGLDIIDRLELGLLDNNGARREMRTRKTLKETLIFYLQSKGLLENSSPQAVLKACLTFLSGSKARVLLVNLENLWMETEPQNVPTTSEKCPNWRRKARFPLETFSGMHEVKGLLQELNAIRRYGDRV